MEVVGAETYIKTPGFTLSRYTVKTGGEAATLDFTIPLTDDGPILIEDVRRGAWRGATIVVSIADTANPANRNIIAQGFVGRLDFTDRLDGKLELVTLADALKDWVPVSTSRPNPEAILEVYDKLAADGADEIVSVHISSELSGTYESAQLAAKRASVPVTPVDSRQVGMGTGFAVLAAADAIADGADAVTAAEAARIARTRTVAPPTLA